MDMKKFLCTLTALAVILGLAACGGSGAQNGGDAQNADAQTEDAQTAGEETAEEAADGGTETASGASFMAPAA